MSYGRFSRALLAGLIAIAAGLPGAGIRAAEPEQVTIMQIDAKSLAGNLLGDPTKQRLTVCLPPSYFQTEKNYPVVYCFHGFGELTNAWSLWDQILPSWQSGTAKEFILVGVNGRNAYYGSFYVNSPVIGGWEDYTVKDIVQYIDSHYRTIPTREARGLAGFSMGGFAALNLALRHPDVYGATYAFSPGLLAPGGLTEAFRQWDGTFKQAYGVAFAPDPAAAPYARIPKFDGTAADAEIIKAWESGFGDLERKVQDYLAKDTPLLGIRIQVGIHDQYTWIPKGCAYFSGLLSAAKIPHELVVINATHVWGPVDDLATFFSRCLAFE